MNKRNFINIKQILKEEINEYLDTSYDDLKSDHHNLPIVYQLAFEDRLPSIFKNGFSREFAASAGGNYYCTGLYTTFDLNSTIENSKTKANLYGGAIIKMGIKSYDRFFICNKKIAQKVYGNKFRLEDQLEILFKDYPHVLHKFKTSHLYDTVIQTENKRTAMNVAAFLTILGGMLCQADHNLNKLDIRGFVFYGSNDGNVAIIRDFKSIVPLAYSLDNARTWKQDLFTQSTYENTANDYDPIIFLGKDTEKYINPKKYRMINGYMKVQSKANQKFNFLDTNKELLSPIWFNKASDMNDNGLALVMNDDGETFYVGKDGYYESENDDYPFMTFDEV